jgi:hypothetical protein
MAATYNDPGERMGSTGAGNRIAGQQWVSDSTARRTAPAGDGLGLRLREWRAIAGAGALLGRAAVELRGELIISDVAVFEKGGRRWCQLPSEPQRDRDGLILKDERGRAKYRSALRWRSRDLQDSFGAELIAAIERQYGPLGGGS